MLTVGVQRNWKTHQMSKAAKIILTETDIANTVNISNAMSTTSVADTISWALSLASTLLDHTEEGDTKLILKNDKVVTGKEVKLRPKK